MSDRNGTAIRASLLALVVTVTATAADWPTHRGNVERTGNIDGQAGPKSPKVLWVVKSTDHFVAPPVVVDQRLFVSGLGAFNTTSFQALSTAPDQVARPLWTKGAPYLKLPTVCPPAAVGSMVVFGDGMHQTDGAILHGLRADSGLPIWQYSIPGQLVHLEGGPTIHGTRVTIGAGNAGVVCLETARLELEGKEVDQATAQAMLQKRWQELVAKYEQEKKVDPDFAIPPSEDALPKPRPKVVWQRGAGQWHVDAPVCVAGDRVLVATARLELEKTGERALAAVRVSDGGEIWKVPVALNPWGGPTVTGDTVLVGGSNIRLEMKDVPTAKGEVAAFQLATGVPKWRREFPGGVVSSIAVQNGLAVFTATDGKVRAVDVVTGQDRWTYATQAPMFAAPAVAGGAVYAADLKGVVHAVALTDGKPIWKLDLAADPAIQASGQVYGGPVLAGGRLFVATCNLEATAERRPSVVVCLGER